MISKLKTKWSEFVKKHPSTSQFLTFFMLSNGITLLQLILMPVFKGIFDKTSLIGISFQAFPVGGSYIFDYAKGFISEGGGGGLAYFLAVQITLLIAQVINFFVQRNVTFKSKSNIGKAAFWYLIAYIIITFGAAALQIIYKDPIYNFFINTVSLGKLGETIADVITMLINSLLSFWVFFPIMKVIFKTEAEK